MPSKRRSIIDDQTGEQAHADDMRRQSRGIDVDRFPESSITLGNASTH